MSQLTAAHRTLPLGSWVIVESLLNGRTVEVRITDRGFSADRRILELSPAAARLLGAVGPAVLPVRLRVAGLPGSPPRSRGSAFSVEVASFTSEYRAQVLKDILDRAWHGAHVQRSEAAEQTFYRVRVGNYSTRREARRLALRLAASGYPVVVMEE
jgi:rare lipoprotein A